MNKFVVTVFPDEKKAFEGVQVLQKLHDDGSVTLYGTTVIQREKDGRLSVKQETDEGPLGMGVGMLTGGLLGLLGGPAGAAIGLASGGLAGMWRDVIHAEVSDDFLDEVLQTLAPGKFAVVAELSEDWLAPIDVRMGELGGTIIREARRDFVDRQIERTADAVKTELDQRRSEIQADAERRKTAHAGAVAERMETALQQTVDSTQKKLQKTADKARARLLDTKGELDAKLKALDEQAAKADPDTRRRVQQRIAELRTDFGQRERALTHAYELAQEALNP